MNRMAAGIATVAITLSVAISAHADDKVLRNPNGEKTLCFAQEDGFHSFFACGDSLECKKKVFSSFGGAFVPNGTHVGIVDVHIFGYTKIIVKEGPYAGEQYWTAHEWLK